MIKITCKYNYKPFKHLMYRNMSLFNKNFYFKDFIFTLINAILSKTVANTSQKLGKIIK